MSVLITGASSGLGAALALAYAKPGTLLALGGRNLAGLEETAQLCRSRGAAVLTRQADVRDAAAMADWIRSTDLAEPLELVIANAGISVGEHRDDLADTVEIFATNVDGVVNTVLPAITTMRPRGHGQLALVSSLYGIRPKGQMPAYSASKAAVRMWGQALQRLLADSGLSVSVISPGFIRTPMTEGFAVRSVPVCDAARRIKAALERHQDEIAFPLGQHLAHRMKGLVPKNIERFARRLHARARHPWSPSPVCHPWRCKKKPPAQGRG